MHQKLTSVLCQYINKRNSTFTYYHIDYILWKSFYFSHENKINLCKNHVIVWKYWQGKQILWNYIEVTLYLVSFIMSSKEKPDSKPNISYSQMPAKLSKTLSRTFNAYFWEKMNENWRHYYRIESMSNDIFHFFLYIY